MPDLDPTILGDTGYHLGRQWSTSSKRSISTQRNCIGTVESEFKRNIRKEATNHEEPFSLDRRKSESD